MWISPRFHLNVIRAYDALVAQPAQLAIPDFRNPAAALPWAAQFGAADACAVLGIGNVSSAMLRLNDDEVGISTVDTLRGGASASTPTKGVCIQCTPLAAISGSPLTTESCQCKHLWR